MANSFGLIGSVNSANGALDSRAGAQMAAMAQEMLPPPFMLEFDELTRSMNSLLVVWNEISQRIQPISTPSDVGEQRADAPEKRISAISSMIRDKRKEIDILVSQMNYALSRLEI